MNKMDNEQQYLNSLREVYENGYWRETRNARTKSIFGLKMVFDLQYNFPILTTKFVPWKMVLRELLWFISGSTSIKSLQKNNIHIWDKNASKEFLESRGLNNYQEGELGPVYGFQWRHIGAKYYTKPSSYKNKGIDQLKLLIKMIKEDPTSRRLILTAWNPIDINKMALPPCHMTCQFYVRDGYLDCQLYQRSADMFLGVPFNICSYSMLSHIVAHCCDLKPGKLIHIIGDAHIYESHMEVVKTQLERPLLVCSPIFEISENSPKDIDLLEEKHFSLKKYEHMGSLKAEMVM